MHLGRVVDGPDVHLSPGGVRTVDAARRDDRQRRARCGHLQRAAAAGRESADPGRHREQRRPAPPRRRGRRWRPPGREVGGTALAGAGERADADPVVRPRARRTQVGQRRHRRLGLDVDVEPDVGEVLEQLVQRGIGSWPPIRALLTSSRASSAIAPVRSVTRSSASSWKASSDAVAGRVHVGLEVAVAELDGVLERGQRVLEPIRAGAAPVGHRDRPVVVEVGIHDRKYVPFGW